MIYYQKHTFCPPFCVVPIEIPEADRCTRPKKGDEHAIVVRAAYESFSVERTLNRNGNQELNGAKSNSLGPAEPSHLHVQSIGCRFIQSLA